MEKKFEIIELLDTYGLLLTKKQRQIMDDYYNYDLSLSEIADNYGISRQAVNDTIKKVEKTLYRYEKILNLNKIHKGLNAALNAEITEIKDILEKLNKL